MLQFLYLEAWFLKFFNPATVTFEEPDKRKLNPRVSSLPSQNVLEMSHFIWHCEWYPKAERLKNVEIFLDAKEIL